MTISRETTWNLFFVAKVLVGDTRAPQRFPFVQCSFLSTSRQDSNKTHHWINLGNSETEKQSPELSDCLALKVSPAKAKTLNTRFSSKALFFSLDLVCFFFFFSVEKDGIYWKQTDKSQTCLLFNITMIYEVH